MGDGDFVMGIIEVRGRSIGMLFCLLDCLKMEVLI